MSLSRTPESVTRRLLTVLMRSISDNIYFKDRECRFLLASKSMCERFGFSYPNEIIGKTDFDIFTEEHARQAYDDELEIMRSGNPILNLIEKETHPDGSVTYVSSTKMPLYDDHGDVIGTFGISRDVTAQKLAEDEVTAHRDRLETAVDDRTQELRETNERLQQEMTERRRAQDAMLAGERIAAIRSMASGAALNFNSILGVINGYASSIAASFIPNTRVHEQAARILESTDRASQLTHRLMNMADASGGEDAGERRPVSLRDVIGETSAFLDGKLAENQITLKVVKPERMPVVSGDRSQLVDVMMSLMINAAEAMPEGGALRIDAAERVIKKPGDKNPEAEGGTFVMLRVRDTGHGMSADMQEMIFQPFFTTKDSKSAFGLGLTYARSAVMGMGGWIDVVSREGKGATFTIHLPKSKDDSEGAADAPARSPADTTVLLIDDDAADLQFMGDALTRHGYRVLSANTGSEAAEMLGSTDVDVHLCILDASIEGGLTTLQKRMQRKSPQPAVILTSGFSRDIVRGLVPMGRWGYLQKPIIAAQLTGAVEKVFEPRRRS